MTYKCGHKPKPHITTADDERSIMSMWLEWNEGEEDICFQCFRDKQENYTEK